MNLLILDLDETLIYATESPLKKKHDFTVGNYFVYKRPYLDIFLATCFNWFEVAIWTSSSPDYAKEITNNLLLNSQELKFIWASDRCTTCYDFETVTYYWSKNLKKVKRQGYQLEKIICVDDSPEKHQKNYGNLVKVKPFFGSDDDNELNYLLRYLDIIKQCDNVRKIDIKNWKQKAICLTNK